MYKEKIFDFEILVFKKNKKLRKAMVLTYENYNKEIYYYDWYNYRYDLWYTSEETISQIEKEIENEINIPEGYIAPCVE